MPFTPSFSRQRGQAFDRVSTRYGDRPGTDPAAAPGKPGPKKVPPFVPSDPNFSFVRIMCHMDGADAGVTFTNNATAPGAPNVTNAGGNISTQSTVYVAPKFGISSAQSIGGGMATDVMIAADEIGTGDFTVEFWYSPHFRTTYFLLDYGQDSNPNTGTWQLKHDSTNFLFATQGATQITGGTYTVDAWSFIAVSRVSGVTRMYVDGNQVGSSYTDTNTYLGIGRRFWLGRDQNSSSNSTGNYDDWRFTNGVGRYAGTTCPVPTSPFPDA